MIKVKDGYAKLIGTTFLGSANRVLLSNGGDFGIHTGRNNEANKLVRTDASGYIQAGWINTTSGNFTGTPTRIYASNDEYIRYMTPANFFSTLANDSNQVSITVAGQNRKLTVAYATNADTLDNLHASAFMQHRGWWKSEESHSADGIATGMYFAYPNHGVPNHWGTLVTFAYQENASYDLQLHGTGNNYLYYRNRSSDYGQKPWKRLADASELKDPANYYWANIPVSTSSSTSTSPTFQECYANGWFRSSGNNGWYNPTNSCHVYPNATTTYGGLMLRGEKGGYTGFILGTSTNYMNLMDNGTDKGLYQEGKGWILYYNRSNNYVGIRTSSLSDPLTVSGITRIVASDKYLRIGPQNSSHAHYETNASVSHWFNKTVQVDGNVEPYGNNEHSSGSSSNRWSNVYSYLGNFAGNVNVGGHLILKGSTTENMTYSGNVHPAISFENSDSSQNVRLIFTDFDNYRSPAGLKLVGNQGGEWLEVAGTTYGPGFYHTSYGSSSYLLRSDGGAAGFHWSGQSGQPTWLWGGNSQHTYYVYNPANFSVNYANSSGYTTRLYANSTSNLTTAPGEYSLAYSRFQSGVSNIFPVSNNANGCITAHLHGGDYYAQIGLSSNGRMYYRTMMAQTLSAGVGWNTVAWVSDITKSQVGLGNVQNTAFYKRTTTVNGTAWSMAGTTNGAAFTIYAPTTAGTSGQVLTSSGGTPGWTNQSSLSVGLSSALYTGSVSGTSHANALLSYFSNYKSSIPRNKTISFYSSAYSNGSQYMGYFLSGYDSSPYGGFFVAHYNNCYYVGITNGSYSEQQIITSSNIGSQSVNYATTAGTANSVAWANVTGKPTIPSFAAKGSATQGVYLSGTNTFATMTYSLNATVNAGTANKLAYYSGANAVSAATGNYGGESRLMYLNAGVPTNSTANVGLAHRPIYMNLGSFYNCSYKYHGYVTWGTNSSGSIVVYQFGPIVFLHGYITKINQKTGVVIFTMPSTTPGPIHSVGWPIVQANGANNDRNTIIRISSGLSSRSAYIQANYTEVTPGGNYHYISWVYLSSTTA